MQRCQVRPHRGGPATATLLPGAAALALVIALTACGGSDGGIADPTDRASSSASATTSGGTPTGSPTVSATASASASTTAGTSPAPSGAEVTQRPVGLDQTGVFRTGLTATITAIEPLTATAALPGEIAGPAVRLTVAVQNGLATALELGSLVVDLQDAAAASATPLTGNGSKPLSGSLAPGSSATGVYVFSLAVGDRTGVTVYVTASASLPVVVFAGDLT